MLTKIVNGKTVILTAAEEEEIKKDWINSSVKTTQNQWFYDREHAYPSIVDQLDLMYHVGFEGWNKVIQAVKDKYPKPS